MGTGGDKGADSFGRAVAARRRRYGRKTLTCGPRLSEREREKEWAGLAKWKNGLGR